MPLHLETIDSWKKEKVPEYAVIVSTNTPSHFIDYTKNDAYYFGDHATAIVISNIHDGYFNLKKSSYNKFNGYSINGKSFSSAELLGIPTSKHLNFNAEKYIDFQLSELINSTRAIKNYGYNLSFVVTDQINSQLASEVIAKELGAEVKHINTVSSYGYAFGSTSGATLSEIKEEVEIGDMIAVITAGAGLNSGYALLQRE